MEQQQISSDLIRGHIDTIILHTLLDGCKYAQQINDTIEEKSNNEYKINQATLYSSLKRLESMNYVSSFWQDSEIGGRRKFFKLTESGKKFVEDNLSNWSFSRSIIDKLMDLSPEPVYKTEYVEKIVEVPKYISVPISDPVTPAKTFSEEDKSFQAQYKNTDINSECEKFYTSQQNTSEVSDNIKNPITAGSDQNANYIEKNSNQEINYKNILNGLIKANAVEKEKSEEELSPISKENNEQSDKSEVSDEKTVEKAKFNQTLNEFNYNENRSNNGKIDFGDLLLKAAKEGYKLRISSKDSYVEKGSLFVNKLNACASVIIFLLATIEFLLLSTGFKSVLNFSTTAKIITICTLSIFPLIMLINYFIHPGKSANKKVSMDSVLTSAIIVFNLILITLAATLLFNLDYTNLYVVLLHVVFPVAIYLDIFVYFVLRFLLNKSKTFHANQKNTKKII